MIDHKPGDWAEGEASISPRRLGGRHLLGPLALVLCLWVAPVPAEDLNAGCLRCHGITTLADPDPESEVVLGPYVAAVDYRHSVHGEMDCADCHRPGYRRYPHRRKDTADRPSCVGCHVDDEGSPFLTVGQELRQSVHVVGVAQPGATKAEGQIPLDCFACHDAQTFRPARVGDPITGIVRGHNQVCLSCHGDLDGPLNLRHDWLPNPNAHWESARCVDCHTPSAGGTDGHQPHRILPADQSHRDCVGCHSADGILLGRLYAYRSAQEPSGDGWLARAFRNEAYLVGMSRNETLDRIALSILGLLVLAILAHGIGRWRVGRTRPNREGQE
jgi:hypothetical protein